MIGIYVAATIVVLLQFLRLRDRRLLPLAALFAFQALALNREWDDVWKVVDQGAACASGLLLLLMLTPRHSSAAKAPSDPAPPPPGAPSDPAPDERPPAR